MNDDDDVGFARPPRHTRFKKGRSGNPRGRPKGAKTIKTIIQQELDAPIPVQENGRRRTIRRSEALVKGLVADALKGKDRPRKQLFDLVSQIERAGEFVSEAVPTADEDVEIIRRFLEREHARVEARTKKPQRGPRDDGHE